jgi:hypothetical protein
MTAAVFTLTSSEENLCFILVLGIADRLNEGARSLRIFMLSRRCSQLQFSQIAGC